MLDSWAAKLYQYQLSQFISNTDDANCENKKVVGNLKLNNFRLLQEKEDFEFEKLDDRYLRLSKREIQQKSKPRTGKGRRRGVY